MTEPMVSIVSPVYNSEAYVGRMLDSVLRQSHPNIEMITVDDGSEDGTERVIRSYRDAFDEKGMRLVYEKCPHMGQTAAVSAGLKLANGEYLSWLDSDDFLTADSVETKLRVLREHDEAGVVTSNNYVVEERDIETVVRRGGDVFGSLNYQSNQFYLLLAGMSIIIPGCHLVSTKHFDAAIPERELVPCIEGQNFQLLLPLYYRYRRAYVPRPLAYYVLRKDSHAHRARTVPEWIERRKNLLTMFEQVLEGLDLTGYESKRMLKLSYSY